MTPERVDGFARFLLSPDRRLPVIGLSTRDNDWFDASKFVRDNIGVAHVAIVLPDSTWSLSAQLPDGIGVYGGAARVWWPGLTAGSVRWDHPLWVGDREASQVRRQVGERIRSVATAATAEDVRWTRLARERRTRELESFRSEAQQLAERLAATTPAEGVPTDWAAVEQIRADAGEQFGLAMQMLEDAALEVELEQQLAAAEKQRADAAEAAVRRLEAERDFYKDAVDRLGTSIGATDMPEVEQSLRREIGMYR